MWNASNIGFANGPLLNQGAIEAIELVGSDEQKKRYIPNLVSGKWTGTMNLTEPQAGSDLAQVRTKAVPNGDHYLLTGEKIFITFGEHDMAENIVHLVLARLPDAPEGAKGISLFIVPKVHRERRRFARRTNDVVCAGIEHKLGINGNPTCTMNFGENGKGAVGYLVGEANRGLEYMFIMMNAARFSVGVQGFAVADRAYQHSLEYAKERVQMSATSASRNKTPVRIIEHPDVRRMLMWQKAKIEAMRALSYVTAASLDLSHKHPDEKVRKEHKAFVELMIPVVKGWCTENAVELCSTALQIFGGMGYVEETGIAQQYRDVRITTIYEGTTGIQALDLVGRKLIRDMGATATTVIKDMEKSAKEAAASENADVKAIGEALLKGIATLAEVSQWIGMNAMGDLRKAFACSVPYLKLWGVVAGGWQMARARKSRGREDRGRRQGSVLRGKAHDGEVLRVARAHARRLVQAPNHRRLRRRDDAARRSIRTRSEIGGYRVIMPFIDTQDHGAVRVITLDNPPVNALSFALSARTRCRSSKRRPADPAIKAVVFTGANGHLQRRRRRQRLQHRTHARNEDDSRRNRGGRKAATKSLSPRSKRTRSAAASNCRLRATIASRKKTQRSACRKSNSACCRAPAARSVCRG